ncbi:MAG: zf-HC2 domain-containing protein [Gemmatimonadaceae bacterium]|nr:zf-HC2 domain-containing protein [Gemmatimonadaceae bacterium]
MTYDKHDCDLMCERLAAYIEGDLTAAERAVAERHLAECKTCAEALVELRAIAGEAAQLPLLTPSRDLWAGIESRISTPVTLLDSTPASARPAWRRRWQFAIAAGALIAVPLLHESVTWTLVAGGALMAAGVWLHLTERHEHPHWHGTLQHSHPHFPDSHHRHDHP